MVLELSSTQSSLLPTNALSPPIVRRTEGTLPDNWFSDKSMELSFNFSKPSGIKPVSLFREKSREFKELINEIVLGIRPLNEFEARFKSTTLAQFPRSDGMDPVNEFSSKCNDDNCCKDPISEGITPEKLLLFKYNFSRFISLPSSDGS
ncbi:hypothetical protein OIU79_030980 [Salix purpurea]|uniref:Uncharacterized protein n=1 Tax=Salix purpurea TaxID=77065 RepID=A0A9Q0ZS72_SALPP|nr:hypothetical protein OIU79_030980 [Salix purpurea]